MSTVTLETIAAMKATTFRGTGIDTESYLDNLGTAGRLVRSPAGKWTIKSSDLSTTVATYDTAMQAVVALLALNDAL